MKKKLKMNWLYKTSFILLLVCFAMFIAAIIAAYLLTNQKLSAIFSFIGVFLAFLGIVFATISKPKAENSKSERKNESNFLDNN